MFKGKFICSTKECISTVTATVPVNAAASATAKITDPKSGNNSEICVEFFC